MNIIKRICQLCKDKQKPQLSSMLKNILEVYISRYNISNTPLKAYLDQFNTFRPGLQCSASTEVELDTQPSDAQLESKNDLLEREGPKIRLKTRKNQEASHFSVDSFKALDYSAQEIKRLAKVFTLLNSKKIKILILLMENKNLEIRRLSVVFFQVLLAQSKSKVHFVEKCALGYSPGLYCLTRLKYLQQKGAAALDVLFLIEQIKGFVKTAVTKIKLNGHCIFGMIHQTSSGFTSTGLTSTAISAIFGSPISTCFRCWILFWLPRMICSLRVCAIL